MFSSPLAGEGRISTRGTSVRNSGEGWCLRHGTLLGFCGTLQVIPGWFRKVGRLYQADRKINSRVSKPDLQHVILNCLRQDNTLNIGGTYHVILNLFQDLKNKVKPLSLNPSPQGGEGCQSVSEQRLEGFAKAKTATPFIASEQERHDTLLVVGRHYQTDNKIDKGSNTNYNSNIMNYKSESKNVSEAHRNHKPHATHSKKFLVPYCLSNLVSSQKTAFTLAEVLITLGIIGIVAAMTIPTLVTNIRNKGYVERFFKTYSVLQNASNMIVAEVGDPVNWSWAQYGEEDTGGNDSIVDLYRKYLKVAYECGADVLYKGDACHISPFEYKYLNGQKGTDNCIAMPSQFNYCLFSSGNQLVLSDGSLIGFTFKTHSNGIRWGLPDLLFTIDVNGRSGPNQIGRDVFFVYLKKNEHGKIRPYTNEEFRDGGTDYRNTCEDTTQLGFSCAYRIFQERKMNY